MNDLTFNFHSDPGHGWLEVPIEFLKLSGIAGKVSRYSYQGNGCAYLEEDCDLSIFNRGMEKAGIHFTVRELPQAYSESFVRHLERFNAKEFTA